MVGLGVTLLYYLVAAFPGFLAPYSSDTFNAEYAYAPPQQLHILRPNAGGRDHVGLYVYGYTSHQSAKTLQVTYTSDPHKVIPVGLFVRGDRYRLLGLISTDIHLIGPQHAGQPMYLLGADANGYDMASRMLHGTRVSMSIGLIGVALGSLFGIVLGSISGYFGGAVDTVIQRLVEFVMSIPTLPLWLGLAAAVPSGWGPLKRYFVITLILSGIAWTHLARVVRGRFFMLRDEDFIMAAHLDGARRTRVMFRHMLPLFTSHLIAALTLSIPSMILAETSLSFLGLGLQPPVVSWGVLLQQAQNIRAVSSAPWLLLPGILVVIVVLALNFLGDGLRDAADPYK